MLVEISTVAIKLIKISKLKNLEAIEKIALRAFFISHAPLMNIVHQRSAIV